MLPKEVPTTPENIIGLRRLEENNQTLKTVLSTKEGRHLFSEIFRTFYMFSSPHQDHGAKTSFNCGQQSVCLWLREWIKQAGIYEKYQLLEKEDIERSQRWDSEHKNLLEKPPKGSNL